MQKMRALSIRTKLILLILLLLFPYLLLNIYSYIKMERQIEQNAMHYSEQLVQQLNGRLDTYFTDLERSSVPIITHPLVKKLMELSPEDSYQAFYITKRIKEELIPGVIFERPEIYGFMMMTDRGVSVGNFRGTKKGVSYINDWMEGGGVPTNRYKIVGIHFLDSQPIVTIARKFWSLPSYEHSGYLVFELRLNHITQPFTEVEIGQSGFISAFDENHRLFFHPKQSLLGKTIERTYLENLNTSTGSFIKREGNGQKKIVSFHHSESSGLTVLAEVPYAALSRELDDVRNMNTWIHLVFIVIAVIGVSAFSFSLTGSISHLQKLMKKAEKGYLHIKAPENRHDEIGRLNKSFNHMVSEIRRLIEVIHKAELREKDMAIKQREAMFRVMQSQINPHFLYNTLEIINSYAIVQGVMPISRMVTALGEMFRYSISDKQSATLQDEIDHVAWFLDIQRERYPQLKVKMAFDRESLSGIKAVRLLVQPIVENAFKHGYRKNRQKPEYIGIYGDGKKDWYRLVIVDRGKGMDPHQKAHYDRLLQADTEKLEELSGPEINQVTDGIGLWNVHQRLRLAFGDPYGVSIIQSGENGTIIELRLPYHQNDINEE